MKIVIKDDEPLNKANEKYEYFNSDDELRKMYDAYIEQKRKHRTDIEIAEKKGMEKKAIETAKKLRAMGLKIEQIIEATSLSKEDIEKL